MATTRMKKIIKHLPVLLDEVIENLSIKKDGIYVDATFGRGGHANAILERLNTKGKLVAFDKDPEAITFAQQQFSNDPRVIFCHSSFSQLKNNLTSLEFAGKVNGILFDLGVSSPQLEDASRGFSFMREGQLDMRMNTTAGMTAAEWLAEVEEKKLADVLWTLGEERFSRRIARAVVEKRAMTPIKTTLQLAEIIKNAIPKRDQGKHPATRSFQAIRIFINQELDDLEQGLQAAYEVLAHHGRMLVISFHSLEDRIVKRFIQQYERGEKIPAKLPVKHQHHLPKLKHIGRAIKPTVEEIAVNPRARSAVLRIAEKLS